MPLPLYHVGNAYVEAFMIVQIEVLDTTVVMWGTNGIRVAVRRSYLDDCKPRVGGYYVSFFDGAETFVNAEDFNINFQPAE